MQRLGLQMPLLRSPHAPHVQTSAPTHTDSWHSGSESFIHNVRRVDGGAVECGNDAHSTVSQCTSPPNNDGPLLEALMGFPAGAKLHPWVWCLGEGDSVSFVRPYL